MKVQIKRNWKFPEFTLGAVSIDGNPFCECVEDTDRGLRQDMSVGEIERIKVYGKTAIPTGSYKVTMNFSAKYKKIMPQIMNVKGFVGVRIHSGNKSADSLGCVLLGRNSDHRSDWVSDSRVTCNKFNEMLKAAGGTCELEIV